MKPQSVANRVSVPLTLAKGQGASPSSPCRKLMFVLIGMLVLAGSGFPARGFSVGPPPPPPPPPPPVWPGIIINQPTANESESNSLFTAAGTVTSNYGGQAVFYSLNGLAWTPAVLDDTGNNWTASLNPIPGRNTFQAYVVDNSGYITYAAPVRFTNVVNVPLTVHLAGVGTLHPNYSNALLQIGAAYIMVATPVAKSGYTFTNWTGGTTLPLTRLNAGATIRFTMVSNLVLQANFTGSNLPAIGVTNQSVSGGNFVAAGTNEEVTEIFGQLNGGAWNAGTVNTNNRTWTWAMPQTNLIPGTNVLQFYGQTASGAFSPSVATNYFLAVPAMLTVMTYGSGMLNPPYNGQLLVMGKTYTMTAQPASGFKFAGWFRGTNLPLGLLTNQPTVKFTMVSNLMLAATFVKSGRSTLTMAVPANGLRLYNSGSQRNGFNFTISGSAKSNVVVEACENLAEPLWLPVSTNALANGLLFFSDVQSSNYPARYYRVRSQ